MHIYNLKDCHSRLVHYFLSSNLSTISVMRVDLAAQEPMSDNNMATHPYSPQPSPTKSKQKDKEQHTPHKMEGKTELP